MIESGDGVGRRPREATSARGTGGALGSSGWALGVGLIGLCLRIAAVFVFSRFSLVGDSHSYDEMARRLLSGEAFTPVWPPGLPYYIAMFYRFLGEREIVAMASMLLWYVACAVILHALSVRVAGRRAAGVAVATLAVWPFAIYHSVFPLTHVPVATMLLAVALLLVHLTERPRTWMAAAAGVVLGWGVLVRPSALILAVGAPAVLASWRRNLRPASLVMLVGTVVVLTPWLIKAGGMTKRFVPINYASSRNLYLGNNPWTPLYKTWWFGSHLQEGDVPEAFIDVERRMGELPVHERSGAYRHLTTEHVINRPDLFLLRTVNRVRVYLAFDTYVGAVLSRYYSLPMALGLAVILLDAGIYICIMLSATVAMFLTVPLHLKRNRILILLLLALGYAVPYWFSFSHPTFHMPTVMLLLIPAAALVGWRAADTGTPRRALLLGVFRRRSFRIISAVFVCIQLEWVYVMASGLLRR